MTDLLKETHLYSTADLGIAVFLFTTGHELRDTSLHGPKRLRFHFEKKKDTEGQVAKYLNETGFASAKRLFENYRTLRAVAFERTGNLR